MPSKLRNKKARVSFFAFQDMITTVTGVLILIMLLLSLGVSQSAFTESATARDQLREKLEAARAADAMLSSWLAGPPGAIAVPAQAPLEGSDKLIWRTTWRPNIAAENLGARVVRLDVSDRANAFEPVLTVEFVIHDFRQTSPATQPAEVQ